MQRDLEASHFTSRCMDGSVVRCSDGRSEGESEAGSAVARPCRVGLPESVEQVGQHVFWKTEAIIFNG